MLNEVLNEVCSLYVVEQHCPAQYLVATITLLSEYIIIIITFTTKISKITITRAYTSSSSSSES